MKRYGLIGKTLSHSFSKRYFTEKFAQAGIAACYELFELASIAEFPALLQREPHLAGLNVTIPYKEAVMPYLDRLSPAAEAVGAVNTICFETDGSLSGHNTDVLGFQASLEQELQGQAPLTAALVLGTGGAAKAVAYVLQQQLGVAEVQLVSRHPEHRGQLSYEALRELDLSAYPLIVNTTPLGMYPKVDAAPDLPYGQLGPQHLVFDLVYNPAETRFMRRAAEQGARTCNGLGMLYEQAEQAWLLWNRDK
jgi:shikimate dehydrogenase